MAGYSYIPGYEQGSNPLADYSMKNKVIKYESAPVDPQPTTVYQDAIFRQKAGDTAPIPNPVPVSTNVAAPDELPPAPEYEDAIFRQISGDTAAIPDPEPVDFEPHYMYDPGTGEKFYAATFQDHLRYEGLGYVHNDPNEYKDQILRDQEKEVKAKAKDDDIDGGLALIGLGAILYVGSMLLG